MRRRRPDSDIAPVVPDAVAITNRAGELVAWDCRAAHEIDTAACGPGCRCIEPVSDGIFRHLITAQPVGAFDELTIARWLAEHPRPVIALPGYDAWLEPLEGCTVADVVRAAVREGVNAIPAWTMQLAL